MENSPRSTSEPYNDWEHSAKKISPDHSELFATLMRETENYLDRAEWIQYEPLILVIDDKLTLLPEILRPLFIGKIFSYIERHYSWKMPEPSSTLTKLRKSFIEKVSEHNELSYYRSEKNIPNQDLVEETIEYFETGEGARAFEALEFLNLLWKQYKIICEQIDRPELLVYRLENIPLTDLERHILYGLIIKWFGGYPLQAPMSVGGSELHYQFRKKILEKFLAYEGQTPEKDFCKADFNQRERLQKLGIALTASINYGVDVEEVLQAIEPDKSHPTFTSFDQLFEAAFKNRDYANAKEKIIERARYKHGFDWWLFENKSWEQGNDEQYSHHLTLDTFQEYLDSTGIKTLRETYFEKAEAEATIYINGFKKTYAASENKQRLLQTEIENYEKLFFPEKLVLSGFRTNTDAPIRGLPQFSGIDVSDIRELYQRIIVKGERNYNADFHNIRLEALVKYFDFLKALSVQVTAVKTEHPEATTITDLIKSNSKFDELKNTLQSKIEIASIAIDVSEFISSEIKRVESEFIKPLQVTVSGDFKLSAGFSFDQYTKLAFDSLSKGLNYPVQNIVNNARREYEGIFKHEVDKDFEKNVIHFLIEGVGYFLYQGYLKQKLKELSSDNGQQTVSMLELREFFESLEQANDFSPLKKYIRDKYLNVHPNNFELETLKRIKREISTWRIKLMDLNTEPELQEFIKETMADIDLKIERYSQKDETKTKSKFSYRQKECELLNIEEQAAKELFTILKPFFSAEHQGALEKLLLNGTDVNELLLFRDNGNRLADAFKQLWEHSLITGCQKQDLETFILRSFQYLHRNAVKGFTPDYAEKCLSRNDNPCKNPLIRIEAGKVVKAEEPRRRKRRKY